MSLTEGVKKGGRGSWHHREEESIWIWSSWCRQLQLSQLADWQRRAGVGLGTAAHLGNDTYWRSVCGFVLHATVFFKNRQAVPVLSLLSQHILLLLKKLLRPALLYCRPSSSEVRPLSPIPKVLHWDNFQATFLKKVSHFRIESIWYTKMSSTCAIFLFWQKTFK